MSVSADRQAIIDRLLGDGWVHRYELAEAFPHLSYAQLGLDLRRLTTAGLIKKRRSAVPGRTHSFPTHEYCSKELHETP